MVRKSKPKEKSEDAQIDTKGKRPPAKTAIFYMRKAVLGKNESKADILSRHIEPVLEKAKELDAEIVKGFTDSGSGNTVDFDKRPGLRGLFEYLAKKKIDYVIIPYFNMLSRKLPTMLELVDKIEQTGAKLVSPSGEEKNIYAYQITNLTYNDVLYHLKEVHSEGEDDFCECCERPMERENDTQKYVCINSKDYERIKAGDDLDFMPDMDKDDTCHDCGVKRGEYHYFGCDAERCPRCKGQFIGCDCEVKD